MRAQALYFGKITLEIDNALVDEINDIIQSYKNSGQIGEFRHLADFFRATIAAYRNNEIAINYLRRPTGLRKAISFRLDKEDIDFYRSLPYGERTEYLERAALRSKVTN